MLRDHGMLGREFPQVLANTVASFALGGVISANNGLDPANAGSPLLQSAVETLQDPNTTFRFDGSDLMPGAVGAGTFWTAMVDWISGADTETVLGQVESSWP